MRIHQNSSEFIPPGKHAIITVVYIKVYIGILYIGAIISLQFEGNIKFRSPGYAWLTIRDANLKHLGLVNRITVQCSDEERLKR